MRLLIQHITTFTYTHPISEAYTEMRLKPNDVGGQHCLTFTLTTEPRGEVKAYLDHYGNDVRHFDVLKPHSQLVVSAQSDVLTPETFVDDQPGLSFLDEYDYCQPTVYAPQTDLIHQFGATHRTPDGPRATAFALMEAVHSAIKYERGLTDVKTTAVEALKLGRGVCQDFAHLMLAACRSQNLPARYVSGYLYAPQSDQTASHAWVDVFVPGSGWISLDPTHNRQQTDYYVRVAVGRDYADVPPTRGVYTGTASEALGVKVTVTAS
jgi:transglutaminase-like putative cysteine protease